MAEHMFAKCKKVGVALGPEPAEDLADLFYEIGKQALTKRHYEAAVKWLERACDVIGEQDLVMVSAEASELRLCIYQGLGKCRSIPSMVASDTGDSPGAYEAGHGRSNRQSLAIGQAHGG